MLLIAGATGFIGRNLVERFAASDDYRVRAVHHVRPPYELDGVEWVQADLTLDADVRRVLAGVDILVQAAATTSGAADIVLRPYIHTADNAVMNSLMLRACYDLGVSDFIFFSCSIMYHPSDTSVREEDWDPSVPLLDKYFPAGWTKIYIEKMCEFYAGLGRTRCTALRHSNIYGPHDKFDLERSHVFGATVTKVMTAEEGGEILVWGTGEEARDLLYVDDLCRCVEACLAPSEERFRLFNVGAGAAVSVNGIVSAIIAVSGKALSVRHDTAKPSIPFTLALDCGRVRDAVGWEPATALDDGIRRTIEWWRANAKP